MFSFNVSNECGFVLQALTITLPYKSVTRRKNRRTFNKNGEVQPSQRNRAKSDPQCVPGNRYTRYSYNRAVTRACEKAGVPKWTPNQLRHTSGQAVRDRYGLEYAQSCLGHANAKTSEIYAASDFEKAIRVAREMG